MTVNNYWDYFKAEKLTEDVDGGMVGDGGEIG